MAQKCVGAAECRNACIDACGNCTEKCYPKALSICGKDYTIDEVREYARAVVDQYGAHTCDGSGAVLSLGGSIPRTYYAFEEEVYRYSLEKYANLR